MGKTLTMLPTLWWGRRIRRSVIFACAIAALIAFASGPANADEISDLRAENQALKSQVQDLANDVRELKDMVMQNQQAVQAVKAPAKVVSSGNENVKLSVSGQVSRMAMYADNGDEARWFHADNDNASTRIRLIGSAKLDEDWSAGSTIEVQFESNSTGDVTINQNKSVIASNSFTERKLEIYASHKRFGKLTLGQGPAASDGTSETDLSGTAVIAKLEPAVMGGSLAFVLSGTSTSSGTTIGNLFNNFDGLSRDDRLRYDSPTFAGAKLSASWVDGDEKDVALRYGREFNGAKMALAASYWDAGPTDHVSGFSLSGSVLAPFGTNLSASYANRDSEATGRNDQNIWQLKLGHIFKPLSMGSTAVSVYYGATEDQNANNTEGTTYGLAVVQKVDKAGAELYALIRQFDADLPGQSTDDITVGGAGARVKF